MKLRLPIFLFSAVALLAFTFYFLNNFKDFNSEGLRAYASNDLTVYSDQLAAGFSDWSWGGDRNFQATDQVKDGSSSISFTPSGWAGFYLHTDNQIDVHQYESLTFALRGSADGQKFAVMLYDNNNQMIGSPHSLSNFGGDIENNNWKTYTISLRDLDPSAVSIKGLGLQETTGQNQPTIHIDNISLIGKAIATPTPTLIATPTPTAIPTNAPTSLPVVVSDTTSNSSILPLFNDTLSTNWENWSWNSNVRFDNASPVYTGSKSVDLQVYSAWGALYLHAKTPIDTGSFTTLNFAAYASQASQKYSIVLLDGNNAILTNPIPLKDIGGDPTQGAWKSYSILLSTLHASSKLITGLIIQDQSGHAQPSLFIDDIQLSASSNVQAQSTVSTPISGNPLSATPLYVQPDTNAKNTAVAWRQAGHLTDADQMLKIANSPTAIWLTDGDPTAKVNDYVTKAQAAQAMPVMVTYNIPGRDCGQYSNGGTTYEGYKTWINKVSDAIGMRKATVILEPDALGLGCLQNDNTYSLLAYAISTLQSHPSTYVYVTASAWVDADMMAKRLQTVGIDHAQGFSLNVSGFDTTNTMTQYGNKISNKIGGKHFVIDTSRNGNGPYDPSQTDPWCNPPDRALGQQPTANTGNSLIDAYLWIKIPGESDGTCRGGPGAGQWWADYALGLVQRANY